jgi:hypothetical protein
MKVLELFAGSRSVGKMAESLGHQVFSSDIMDFKSIDYACSILEFNVNNVGFVPDVIWASPPCTYFSVASIGKHWNKDHTPKTEEAVFGVTIVKATLEIIEYFLKLNPNLIYYIENPRGKLRKLDFMQPSDDDLFGLGKVPMYRDTVTYCQYGDSRMKPTDVWHNNPDWNPRPICKNGAPCHDAAPRGSKTGTQGLKGNYERSVIPAELCKEALMNVKPLKLEA